MHHLSNDNQNQTEKKLVEKIRSGDSTSFKKLFDTYNTHLLNFALQYLNNPQAAEDVVQEVFVNIWINRNGLNPALSIKSYLFTSVRNQALKHIRDSNTKKEKHKHIQEKIVNVKSPEEHLQEKELTELYHQAIEKLPYQCRQIFSMNRFENLSYAEIAETMGISINTVKTQMGRAFKTLRKHLSTFLSLFTTRI